MSNRVVARSGLGAGPCVERQPIDPGKFAPVLHWVRAWRVRQGVKKPVSKLRGAWAVITGRAVAVRWI